MGKLYWDNQDPNNTGWWLRYHDGLGAEQGCAVAGSEDATTEELVDAVAALDLDWTGIIHIIRGDGRRGSLRMVHGEVVEWRAL